MVSAIILAAGQSNRMGEENKLLLPVDGEALVRKFVKSVSLAEVENVLVVIGYEAKKIKNVLSGQCVDFVYNPFYMKGMTTSIKSGIEAVPSESDGFMICLADLPLVKTEDLNILIRTYSHYRVKGEKIVIVPVFKGQQGNPVLFSSEFREKILNHNGEGCRGLITKHSENVKEVIMKNGNLIYDIDTQEDYKNYLLKMKT